MQNLNDHSGYLARLLMQLLWLGRQRWVLLLLLGRQILLFLLFMSRYMWLIFFLDLDTNFIQFWNYLMSHKTLIITLFHLYQSIFHPFDLLIVSFSQFDAIILLSLLRIFDVFKKLSSLSSFQAFAIVFMINLINQKHLIFTKISKIIFLGHFLTTFA